jgi:hypothetical protein
MPGAPESPSRARTRPEWWGRKVARLPGEGVLIVATDLQGNLEDYRALLDVVDREREDGRRAWLVLCGDMVHGPGEELARPGAWPEHLGTYYEDRSVELVLDLIERVERSDVVCLLGNHEHAHVGGPVVSKFHLDEAGELEQRLGPECERVRAFLRGLPLLAVAPCGVVCSHGAPRATEPDLASFEALDYDRTREGIAFVDVPLWRMIEAGTVGALLWARAATREQAKRLLRATSLDDEPNAFVAYGHDIVRDGFERIGEEQICVSTSFGLFDRDKVYLRLDLARRYTSAADLRPGHEILPLHP